MPHTIEGVSRNLRANSREASRLRVADTRVAASYWRAAVESLSSLAEAAPAILRLATAATAVGLLAAQVPKLVNLNFTAATKNKRSKTSGLSVGPTSKETKAQEEKELKAPANLNFLYTEDDDPDVSRVCAELERKQDAPLTALNEEYIEMLLANTRALGRFEGLLCPKAQKRLVELLETIPERISKLRLDEELDARVIATLATAATREGQPTALREVSGAIREALYTKLTSKESGILSLLPLLHPITEIAKSSESKSPVEPESLERDSLTNESSESSESQASPASPASPVSPVSPVSTVATESVDSDSETRQDSSWAGWAWSAASYAAKKTVDVAVGTFKYASQKATDASTAIAGVVLGEKRPGATQLRQCEVAWRALAALHGPSSQSSASSASSAITAGIVEVTRRRTWEQIVDGSLTDMRFFGAAHRETAAALGANLRNVVSYSPDSDSADSADSADSGSNSEGWRSRIASSIALGIYPDLANILDQKRTLESLFSELSKQELRQYAGFESPGVGYALQRAVEMVGVLRVYDAGYARALRVVLAYAASLLIEHGTLDNIPNNTSESIDAVVARMPAIPLQALAPPEKARPKAQGKRVAQATQATRRARACDEAESDVRLRSGPLYREMCAVPKKAAERRAYVSGIISASAGNAMPWDENVFGVVGDIDAMSLTTRNSLAAVVARGKAAKSKSAHSADSADSANSAKQMRRLEILESRLSAFGAFSGDSATEARVDASGALLAHIKAQADAGKTHGLQVHELGCMHTEIVIGTKVVAHTMYTPGPPPTTTKSWFATKATEWAEAVIAPGALKAAREAQETVSRSAQYRGYEEPGIGYVLLALLEIVDHASSKKSAKDPNGLGGLKDPNGLDARKIRKIHTDGYQGYGLVLHKTLSAIESALGKQKDIEEIS
jgi:hypothetical protein